MEELAVSSDNAHAEHHEVHAHTHAESSVHEEHAHHQKGLARYKKHVFVTILYVVVALLMFYQITLHISTVAPGTGADTYQNLWDIWWVKYAVFNIHTSVFYTKLLFFPLGAGLAYQTLAPLLGIISAPFQALFGTVSAYNLMFFMGFALSGLCMFILADHLTKNSYASVVAGFIYAFSAFHIAQSYTHIHYMNIEFVPLFIYFLLKVIESAKISYPNIIGMAASFALTTLIGNIEQTVMLLLAAVFVIVVYLFYKERRARIISWKFLVSMVIFVVLAFVIGAWNFLPLISAIMQPGGLSAANYLNTAQASAGWSTTIAALFVPSYYNGIIFHSGAPSALASLIYQDPAENVGYISYAVIALMLYAVYKYRKEMLPWAIGAVIFTWLALGPNLGLYLVYHAIPGLNIVREPGRFQLISTMFFAILAAYGTKALFERLSKHEAHKRNARMALMVLAVILIVMFVENNGTPLSKAAGQNFTTSISVPPLYRMIAGVPGNFSVLGLPTLPSGTSDFYLYPGMDTFYTSVTQKPIVGGYLGRTSNMSSELLLYNIPIVVQATSLIDNGTPIYPTPITENYTNQTLLALYNYGTSVVVVHYPPFSRNELSSLLSYLVGVFGPPIYNDSSSAAFATTNAINKALYNSFVTYPVVTDWQETSIQLNGTYQTYWVPTNPGSVIVYAPYNSSLSQSAIEANPYSQHMNATVSFTAFAEAAETLYVDEPYGNGTRTIASVGVTTIPAAYSFNVPLVSGPQGNPLFFLYKSGNNPVFLQNLSFSR
ncbi:MAG: hypothetical protein ABSE71_03510 [Candidatus Micrarchaeaceae archaeon]